MISTNPFKTVILILFSHVVIANAAFAEQTTRIAYIPETLNTQTEITKILNPESTIRNYRMQWSGDGNKVLIKCDL